MNLMVLNVGNAASGEYKNLVDFSGAPYWIIRGVNEVCDADVLLMDYPSDNDVYSARSGAPSARPARRF